MKTIILVGGDGIRLHEDIQRLEASDKNSFAYYKKFLDIPKPLIIINKKPIITLLLEKLEKVGLQDVVLCTNDASYNDFLAWRKNYHGKSNIEIVNDCAPENIYGHGVISAVLYVLKKYNIREDVLLLAGDTIFDYELGEVLNYYQKKKKSLVVAHKERPELIQQRGVVQYDSHHKIISFEEKPAQPKSVYAVSPTFLFDSECISLIRQFMQEPKQQKNLGDIISWLLSKGKDIFVFLTEKEIFDIGDIKSIQLAEEFFKK